MRAEALSMRGQAFWGVGRIEEAKAAMNGASQRYEEHGDVTTATALRERLETIGAKSEEVEEPEELELVGASETPSQ